MFKESTGQPSEKKETFGIPQKDIDEVVDAEIERLHGSNFKNKNASELSSCEQRIVAHHFGVELSHVLPSKLGNWKIELEEPKGGRTIDIYIEEDDVNPDRGTVLLYVTANERGNAEDMWKDRVILQASPDRLRAIRERMKLREDEAKAQEEKRHKRFQELLPSTFAFARAHQGKHLSNTDLEPISEFIGTYAGGPLVGDEKMKILRIGEGEPATWQFYKYLGGQVMDILEFSEK
ncbi:MAG: hypothetical protein WC787_02345 [Patescibacteria group bacterium]|jgi:hypothetical protein